MDNVLYYHPRCSFSKDLINRVQGLPQLAASLRPVDVSVQRPRHRIAQVPCIVYEGRMYQGAESFKWLTAVAARSQDAVGGAGAGDTDSANTLPAAQCSMYSDASTLRFVDFNAAQPTVTMAPESYCNF